MKKQPLRRFLSRLVKPKGILAFLALLYFLLIPKAYAALGLCFYNWAGDWYAAFIVLAAALALFVERWWGYTISIFLSGYVASGTIISALKAYRVLPVSPGEAEWVTPERFWGFFARHAENYVPFTLAALILIHASISLILYVSRRRPILP